MSKIYNRHTVREKRRNLRNEMTSEEIALWLKLKDWQVEGAKFRRQYSIGEYIVDFFCSKSRLAIEVDGGYHDEQEAKSYDQQRQREIEGLGIQFLRFTNEQVRTNMPAVIQSIRDKLISLTQTRASPDQQ